MKLIRSAQQRRYDRLVRSLPLSEPIFLPTEKIPLDQAIAGLERVKALYKEQLKAVYRPRLRALREQYAGVERCFVIGNGPSLNRTKLELLENEVTFAVNGFFLKSSELGWSPTFYVVEDHLVAEDRANEIKAFNGPIKLFPANLAYCVEESQDTIFFDHRPRISYPDGFDFSTDAAAVTYTGCTVTFTCLQLAVYLGFRKIYLIGVDADYSIPNDVAKSARYGVDVLDMRSDDPNHFDPNYFGKGYRWHDPQLDKMLEAYEEASRVTAAMGVNIFNAGVGGKLEVFPRVDYASLFQASKPPPYSATGNSLYGSNSRIEKTRPRVAIIDLTLMGDGTATGELKLNLLKNYEEDRLLHVFDGRRGGIAVNGKIDGRRINKSSISATKLSSLLERFSPHCVIYRPVPDNARLHSFAMGYLRKNAIPLVLWVMDDWPERLRLDTDSRYPQLDHDLRWLFKRASTRLCISESMKEAFSERYSNDFVPLANGIDPAEWPLPQVSAGPCFTIRYAGALAENMVLASVCRVAQAIESLTREGLQVRFEINTRPMWAKRAASKLGPVKSCEVTTHQFSRTQYREFLQSADALLIAYNFDDLSRAYIGHSLANKLPECLISGRPLLVHGPSDVATVNLVKRYLPGAVVSTPEENAVKDWIRKIQNSSRARQSLVADCRALGVAKFGIEVRQQKLESLIEDAIEISQN